jgi:L-ribulose-5-phosphate 3-epimerase
MVDDRVVPTIAIMQGRLSPPVNGQLQAFPSATWHGEFALAADAGLDAIEWIFASREDPLLSALGAGQVRELMSATGVRLLSICADYFMDAPLLRADRSALTERANVLRALLAASRELGVRHIVLPFVDQSAIRDRTDVELVKEALGSVSADAIEFGVELHLETSLGPQEFAALLAPLPAVVRANYDSGNSASLGYDVLEEFDSYGHRIGSVHVKDRRRGGGSVPLGTGDVNFGGLFDALVRVDYDGLFTLQTARGPTGDEVVLARQSREFVVQRLRAASVGR